MTTPAAIVQLEHAIRTLAASSDAGDGDVAGCLIALLAGVPVEEAFDTTALAIGRRAERDRLCRTMRARYGLSYERQAALIDQYERSAWKNEKARPECPPNRLDTPNEFCWRILRLGHGRGLSSRTIRRRRNAAKPA